MIFTYFLLAVSITFEVIGTSVMPATKGFTKLKPSLITIGCYLICFAAFGKCLLNMNLGIAWATWGGIGTIVTPIVGYLFYKQRLTKTGLAGLILIVICTVTLNLWG